MSTFDCVCICKKNQLIKISISSKNFYTERKSFHFTIKKGNKTKVEFCRTIVELVVKLKVIFYLFNSKKFSLTITVVSHMFTIIFLYLNCDVSVWECVMSAVVITKLLSEKCSKWTRDVLLLEDILFFYFFLKVSCWKLTDFRTGGECIVRWNKKHVK